MRGMSNKTNDNLLWYKQPAKYWTQALPLGNGRIGAMVYGGITKERICLNEDTLWSGYPRDTVDVNAADAIREGERLCLSGEAQKAQEIIEEKVLGTWGQSYLPLGDIELMMDHPTMIENYVRKLDITQAICTTSYSSAGVDYMRETFISAPDDGLVLRITASKEKQINLMLKIKSDLKSKVMVRENTLVLQGECPGQVIPNYVDSEDPIQYSDRDEERGIRFYGIVGLLHPDGCITSEEDYLKLSGASEVTLCFTVKTSFQGFDKHPYLEGKEMVFSCEEAWEKLAARPYDELKRRHISDYSRLYDRVCFSLGDNSNHDAPTDIRLKEFALHRQEKRIFPLLFQYGRYLLISSSRPGTQPANLQGIWNDQLRAPWSSNYTVNINTQMNYWPVFTCNLAEMNTPLVQLVKDISISGRKTAESYYRARGFVAHHNIDLWRITTPVGPRGTRGAAQWGFWPMGAAWLCRHLFEQYEFTLDKEYLRNEALPILKEACLFGLDILSENDQGYLWACPSTSPENQYLIHGESCGLSATTTMTMSILRDLFTNCITAMELVRDDDKLKEELKRSLPRLLPVRVGSRGQLLEWEEEYEEADSKHRHISLLYGLHPAREFTYDMTPKMMEACRIVLESRGDGGTGWSLGWKVNQWARLRDGDHALKLIKRQLQPIDEDNICYGEKGGTYDNLFDAHPPFQIDGNFGVSAGIAEMLLQSHEGFLSLLPALPGEWQQGCITGLMARGNIEVDLYWQEGELQKASLLPRADGRIEVKYKDRSMMLKLQSGNRIILDAKLSILKN
jgi:alpha-L-fucosidase 2